MSTYKTLVAMILIACAVAVGGAVAEDKQPVGWVDFSSTQVAIGIGGQWGNGELKFNGKRYPIKVNGLSIIDVGVAKMEATGEVYDLTDVNDFPGTYYAATGGAALAGGASGSVMKNNKGVIIHLWGKDKGLKFQLGGEGVKFQLAE